MFILFVILRVGLYFEVNKMFWGFRFMWVMLNLRRYFMVFVGSGKIYIKIWKLFIYINIKYILI